MDSADTQQKLQQLRANLIANKMKQEQDASNPSTSQAVNGTMSPLSSLSTKSAFIPGLSIFQQKLATPQFGCPEPSRFGGPSPPRQFQAATALQTSSFGDPVGQQETERPAQSAPWGQSWSPKPPALFAQSQQTVFGQDGSPCSQRTSELPQQTDTPRPLQSKGTQVAPQQAMQLCHSSQPGQKQPTMSDQKTGLPPSPPGQDFNPWAPPSFGETPLVKLPPSDGRAAAATKLAPEMDTAEKAAANNSRGGVQQSNALIPLSTTSEHGDPSDLDIWLEITGYHDVDFREATIRKHKAEKMVAERRKALEDAQAELDELLQKPVKNFSFTSRLGTPRPDNLALQPYTSAKRPRSPSPGLTPAKRHDSRGSPRRDYNGYGPYRGTPVADRDLDRVVREQEAAKYRRSLA